MLKCVYWTSGRKHKVWFWEAKRFYFTFIRVWCPDTEMMNSQKISIEYKSKGNDLSYSVSDSEHLEDLCYWLQVTQKYHIYSLLNAQRAQDSCITNLVSLHRVTSLTQGGFFSLHCILFDEIFFFFSFSYPLFSSIALWALNPSCSNGGFCCISQFITRGKLWSGASCLHRSLLFFNSCVQDSENRWRCRRGAAGKDSPTFNCSLKLCGGFPLRAHMVEHWFSQYPHPSLGHG